MTQSPSPDPTSSSVTPSFEQGLGTPAGPGFEHYGAAQTSTAPSPHPPTASSAGTDWSPIGGGGVHHGGNGQPPGGYGPPPPYAFGATSGGPHWQPIQRRPSGALNVVALTAGLLAIAGCWIPLFNVLSILCGIGALAFGIPAVVQGPTKHSYRGCGIAGIVTGGLSIIIAIGVNIAFISHVATETPPTASRSSAMPTLKTTPTQTPTPAAKPRERFRLGEEAVFQDRYDEDYVEITVHEVAVREPVGINARPGVTAVGVFVTVEAIGLDPVYLEDLQDIRVVDSTGMSYVPEAAPIERKTMLDLWGGGKVRSGDAKTGWLTFQIKGPTPTEVHMMNAAWECKK